MVMNFHCVIKKEVLYQSLQKIVSIISGRSRLPILNHILLEVNNSFLYISATDLTIEIVAKILLETKYTAGATTVSGRKLFEICRSLPKNSMISIEIKNNSLIICSGCSNFSLSTFESSNFPKLTVWNKNIELTLSRIILKNMIELTQFSMGNQDARYYLNGMFFETQGHKIRLVATDGHRLATCEVSVDVELPVQSIIIPRKGITEILHLLNIKCEFVNIQVHQNRICMLIDNYIFNSKLIDATFPNCEGVFIKHSNNILKVACNQLKETLKRIVILSNERTRVIQFHLTNNKLKVTARNFEHETSEEILNVLYSGKDITISFNADYILDILNVLVDTEMLLFSIINETSSVQIEGISKNYNEIYIIMPIRI